MTLTERRARFIYEAARLQAIAAKAPVVPAPWDRREQPFKRQFLKVIRLQCGFHPKPPEKLHEDWMRAYFAMGWTYGPEYDRNRKIHPDLVPYRMLNPRERDKDEVFAALCHIARMWIK